MDLLNEVKEGMQCMLVKFCVHAQSSLINCSLQQLMRFIPWQRLPDPAMQWSMGPKLRSSSLGLKSSNVLTSEHEVQLKFSGFYDTLLMNWYILYLIFTLNLWFLLFRLIKSTLFYCCILQRFYQTVLPSSLKTKSMLCYLHSSWLTATLTTMVVREAGQSKLGNTWPQLGMFWNLTSQGQDLWAMFVNHWNWKMIVIK